MADLTVDACVAVLRKWYDMHGGISDEMTLDQIDKHNEMYDDLIALGIEPE